MLQLIELALKRHPPDWAVVLGSGLGDIAARVRAEAMCRTDELPGLCVGEVEGHAGKVLLVDWRGQRVLIFAGRLHAYEGFTPEQVTASVRLTSDWGVRRFVFTNAAGGIRDDLVPGTLMAATSVLDATGPGYGHAASVLRCTWSANPSNSFVARGMYAAVQGPNYETPAEIRALRALGADAVGMSTAWEVREALKLGAECTVLSCITNRAAGLAGHRLTHAEVLENAQRQVHRMADVIESLLAGG